MFKQIFARISRLFSVTREDLDADDEKRSREERGRRAVADVLPREEAVLFGAIQSVTY